MTANGTDEELQLLLLLARRIIENTLGIFAARWRPFRRSIIGKPSRVVLYVQAAIALHNYLRITESTVYCLPRFTDGEDGTGDRIEEGWRDDDDPCGMTSLTQTGSNRFVSSINKILKL